MIASLPFVLLTTSTHHQKRRENARYLELVESGRSFQKMEERKRKRREDAAGADGAPTASSAGGDGGEARPGVGDAHRRIRRRFKQSSPVADVGGQGGMDKAVLQSVFGGKKTEGRRENGV